LFGLSLLAIWLEPLRTLVLGLDGLLLFTCVLEFTRLPDPKHLSVARRLPDRAGLSREFERVVRVQVKGLGGGLRLELREVFPAELEVVGRTLDLSSGQPPVPQDPTGGPDVVVLREGANRFERIYRSTVRGNLRLGDLRLTLRGPLGLLERQALVHGEQSIRIEPPLTNLKTILRLAASNRWQDLGVRRLRKRGGLTEFESLREYVVGDDPRLVDWKAFARRGYPVVRDFQEERGQELFILVDGGRRMGATSTSGDQENWTKLDHALDVGLELAAVALQAGDRVGFAVFDSRLRNYVAALKGPRQLGHIKRAVFAELPSSSESDLARALRELSVLHRRRALLVVISEVPDPLSIEHQRRALSSGSKRHSIVLASLDDPSLRAIEEGQVECSAAERSVALCLAEERRRCLSALRHSGARVLDVLPAESAASLLSAWLDARRGRLSS
jgi:uncharacterized protein (DUF58 family)